jgi:hypothetical protein
MHAFPLEKKLTSVRYTDQKRKRLARKGTAAQHTFETTLHHLIVALLVGGDEDDFGSEAVPDLLEKLHRVGPSSTLPRVPENHALGRDVVVDETRDGRAECLLLVGSYPNQEPRADIISWQIQEMLFLEGALTNLDSGCKWTAPPRYRFPCRCEFLA